MSLATEIAKKEIKRRSKISIALKKAHKNHSEHYIHTIDWKNNISKALVGIKRSKETRKKMSVAKNGYIMSEEHRKNLSNAMKGHVSPRKGKHLSEKTKMKMSESKKGSIPWNKGKEFLAIRGANNNNWKGGRMKDKRGYILVLMPKHPFCNSIGYIREHRLIIEKQIGRYLHKFEVAHHINRIKNDNRPENLMAFKNHSIHKKFEKSGKVKIDELIFDGRIQCHL